MTDRATRLRELEEMAAKLLAIARKLPRGPDRNDILQDREIPVADNCARGRFEASAPRAEGEGQMTGPRPAGRRWTEAEESQLREMLDAGMKVPNIARKLNRTAQAIYARLQRIYRRRRATTPTRAAAP
jgi:DNA-binding NarL/FixJ family response regulator